MKVNRSTIGTLVGGWETQPVTVSTTEAISSGESTFDWIDVRSQARAKAGLTRRVRPRQADSTDLDLAGNDYLGLAKDKRVAGAALDRGLITRALPHGDALAFSPPLTITREEVDFVVDTFRASLDHVADGLAKEGALA